MSEVLSTEIFLESRESTKKLSALDFATIGIANHALCLVEKAGILSKLVGLEEVSENCIDDYQNPPLIRSALVTLVAAEVLSLENGTYQLTELGKDLAKNIALISLPLIGYRKLFANQENLLKDPSSLRTSDIDFPEVALASIGFGKENLDPLILDVVNTINPKGTICDLGCGTGEKLINICAQMKLPGLGIERDGKVIKEARKYVKDFKEIEIIQGDLNDLKGTWEDVDTSLISFVCHDIESDDKCSSILKSLQTTFPRMKYLIVVDIVSLSSSVKTIMPGFDYVHGLQNVSPRTYEETIKTFKNAGYSICKEEVVPNMPNTFIWVLSPQKLQDSTTFS